MAASNQLKNQHLLWRAGFGPMAENAAQLASLSQKKLWELLLNTSQKQPEKIEVAKSVVDGLFKGMKDLGEIDKIKNTDPSAETKKLARAESREQLNNLNMRWLDEMINSEAQLREKMSLFWHGHFACRVIHSYFQQELLQIIRTNSLENFGVMLMAVSKSPSMLQFLNNQQNRKGRPNENFAREVMELFTMGHGNYSEQDVKEAARAFTGWGFDIQGEFVFREQFHDGGLKTFLGETGNFRGDDIIKILLARPETADHISRKMYAYFINEKVDPEKHRWLSQRFFRNGYDIKKLLEDIFMSAWFYDERNIGAKIKSPVELLVGIRRFLPLELDNDASQLLFQKVLGQVLFYPPNVAGWPGGRNWIDSSTLMVRLQMPQVFASKERINIRPKNDDDVNMGQAMDTLIRIKKNKFFAGKGGGGDINWRLVYDVFATTSRENLIQRITETLFQTSSRIPLPLLTRYIDSGNRENYIKSAVIGLMSTPEYQLC